MALRTKLVSGPSKTRSASPAGAAIAAQLVRVHGGDTTLVPGTIGTPFHITIPGRAIDPAARRGVRAQAEAAPVSPK